MLDYGAGRGFDADFYHMERYDPNYFPVLPRGTFDTITVNYVLNVMPPGCDPVVLKHLQTLLKPGGQAFISVRRDIVRPTLTQRPVYLDLPLLKEVPGKFAIYLLKK